LLHRLADDRLGNDFARILVDTSSSRIRCCCDTGDQLVVRHRFAACVILTSSAVTDAAESEPATTIATAPNAESASFISTSAVT
jgi:hypothetical protein